MARRQHGARTGTERQMARAALPFTNDSLSASRLKAPVSQRLIIETEGDSMINQISERLRGAGLAMLDPVSLVDRFLDQIERLGAALMPARADSLACQRIRIDRRID